MDTSFYDAAEASMDTTEEGDIAVSLASPKRRKTLASENKNNTFKVARNWVALFENEQNLAKLDADMAALEAKDRAKEIAIEKERMQVTACARHSTLAGSCIISIGTYLRKLTT